ncbi:hypothetical protein FNV43_RR14974 [Rhamnella rubrinervis]|uniref:RNase H type-1 domain-containing protein n=1 Tax=Rhamnella rubrinervis TaxID=2594499 RepID=A0A8K0MGB4_9ROSA|nr:hypothetical protein FNV43_RR14974 [Rhamnella rubrinervis]
MRFKQGKKVADLSKEETNEELLLEICEPSLCFSNLKSPVACFFGKNQWPAFVCEDKLLWTGKNNGVFLVKESYLALIRMDSSLRKGICGLSYEDAALALVLRDCNGKVIFLATKFDKASSRAEAELKGLAWALETTQVQGWKNLIWSTGAENIVKDIKPTLEPLKWHTGI